jgi:nucleolar protein TMA23
MDAKAHLLSLGWAGPGHSLDSRPHQGRRGLAYDPKQAPNNGNGLVKPLLISQKKNTLGIGKKAHEPAAGNEWWLKSFETALSDVGKSESERTSGTATPEQNHSANRYRGKNTDLYSFFIKGAEIEGTIGPQGVEPKRSPKPKKRKSDSRHLPLDPSSSSSEDQKDPTEASAPKKPKSKEGAEEFEQIGAFLQVRDQNEKRRRRKQKGDAVEEFQQVGEFFEVRSARRKVSPSNRRPIDSPTPVGVTDEATEDADDERRRRRKERKAAKAADVLQAASNGKNAPASTGINVDDPNDDSAAPAARRAEKKRRKERERQ